MKFKEKKSHFVTSLYIPQEKKDLMEKLQEIAWRERQDMSPLILKAIKDYVERHGSGNPEYRLENFINNQEFKVTPAFFEKNEKWNEYLDKCDRKELEQIEGKALSIREVARKLWLAKRE